MGRFELWLTTDKGRRIAQLSTGLGLSGSRIANGIGWFNYDAPPSFNKNLVKSDQMFQIWYEPDGGVSKLFNTYFLSTFDYTATGFSFGGPDKNHLLTRRVIAAFSGDSDYVSIGDNVEADTVMQSLVSASLEDSSSISSDYGSREWSTVSVYSASSSGSGPQIYQTFPVGQYLLTEDGGGALPITAKAAKERGTEVFFEMVPIFTATGMNFEFRTQVRKPGSDLTDKVTFDENNLINPHLTIDHSREKTYIYAAGKGQRSDRKLVQVYDTTRYGQSIYGRKEGFADARNSDDDAVEDVGNSALYDGRPKIRFTGKPEPDGFGKTWYWGDIVTTKFQLIQFNSIIRAVTLSVDGEGKIDVDTRLDYES